ncbi:MAG: tRNA-dihydrouridine synthase A [Cellvibrionaceae bacterium]|jgi:tRNA-dihydrouridine synthase A
MDWSDRHCRYLWRLLSKQTRVYTEMITTGALIHGDQDRFLHFHPNEHPIALQVGGSDTNQLAACARLAEKWAYDEINLNCGCPSDRVQNGLIGACLMMHPNKVADGIKAMQDAATIPVTIKHRIGVDNMDDYTGLAHFVETVAATGCNTFIIHARKAWLQGLSPKQNREIPPLCYDFVYQLKQEMPHLKVIINGGITSLDECEEHLEKVDGVMLGREACSNPYLLSGVDKLLFGVDTPKHKTRKEICLDYIDYCKIEMENGTRLHHMTKYILGLFHGQKGGKAFRRHISENVYKTMASTAILEDALGKIID